jgi:hypothetical protein
MVGIRSMMPRIGVDLPPAVVLQLHTVLHDVLKSRRRTASTKGRTRHYSIIVYSNVPRRRGKTSSHCALSTTRSAPFFSTDLLAPGGAQEVPISSWSLAELRRLDLMRISLLDQLMNQRMFWPIGHRKDVASRGQSRSVGARFNGKETSWEKRRCCLRRALVKTD